MELRQLRRCWKNTLRFNKSLCKALRAIAVTAVAALSFFNHGFAQTILQGKVTDAKTTEVVPFANVYLGGTTIGVASDSSGEFKFEVNMKGAFDLIVSFIGYAKVKIPVIIGADSTISADIKLKPESVTLNALTVHGDTTPTRSRDLREFMRILIGTTKNASGCSLKNPRDVFVRKDKSGRSMTAYAKGPIIIENRALGYEVQYDLERFRADERSTSFGGTVFFKELIAANEKERNRWVVNREKAYQGSMVHLIRSIMSDRIQAEGWDVRILYNKFRPSERYILEQIKKFRELGLKDSIDHYKEMRLIPVNERLRSKPLNGHEILDNSQPPLMMFRGVLVVVFKKESDPRNIRGNGPNAFSQSSELEFQTQPHVLYENGSYSPQNDVMLGGYFAFGERIAEWIPYEYGIANK